MSMKARAKNFSSDEISHLVDLVLENKSKLFGSLSSSLTYDEKNNVWENIAKDISQAHGTLKQRNKEDISKKWSNVLAKHKPIICDKISSTRRTGGGSPEAELTELEAKLKSIKGKELFEGVLGGIDISSPSPLSPLSDSDMSIVEVIKPPRKRGFLDEASLPNTTLKKNILETEQEKISLLKSIDGKMDNMIDLLGQIVGINKLQSNTAPQIHPHLQHSYLPTPTTMLPPLAPQVFPPTFLQQHFPNND